MIPVRDEEAPRVFPDLSLPDHTGRPRTLSELANGDPVALFFSRGWWCPKEQHYFRDLVRLQDEFEVAYSRFVAISVDPPEVQAAFRAGLGARLTRKGGHAFAQAPPQLLRPRTSWENV